MKKFTSIVCLLFVFLMVVSIPVGAANAYQTYTYSIDGQALYSPDAYTAVKTLSYQNMGLGATADPTLKAEDPMSKGMLNAAKDIVTDAEGNVYIADKDNNRILILDRYYNLKKEIRTFENDQKIVDKFTKPEGVFVTADRYEEGELKYPGRIYVCDTGAQRIVTFTLEGEFSKIIEKPVSNLIGDDMNYRPVAIAVDA